MPREQEEALNLMLARALSFQGLPVYRISWAADDFNPVAPMCLENQASYHLLVREFPDLGNAKFDGQLGKEDTSKGFWICQMHFIDPMTDKPFDPTAALVERIIPLLRETSYENRLAQLGASEATRRFRAKERIQVVEEKVQRAEREYESAALAMFSDAGSAFGGAGWSGGHGEKTRHSSEIVLTDLR